MIGGLSITSVPLTFLSKLRNKRNPYAQPHHPNNHSHACQAPSHIDLLAHAREAAGRHPITGQSRSSKKANGKGKGKQGVMMGGEEASERKKAYLAWAAKNPQLRGSPYASYEEFVKEKVARRGLPEQAWTRGEYYAPE
ncbi:mitosis dim1 [Pyrenophora seminiperda CCB06]|uniref:Mitosis dim1 n=1 Tax=Pyrenophora seminiperda CCB06 TaxID=1302712 RepID=A0A3M7MDY2_9PLEO|nr:mitosis dim1 [Pyrenophora seminiperda CCB06]